MPGARELLRRPATRAVLVLVSLALLVGTLILGVRRFHVPPEQEELLGYFRDTFPYLHGKTKSLQAALAGLVDETAPAAEVALDVLDRNVLPSIDELLVEARAVRPETVAVRSLHAGYVQAVEGMAADVLAIRAIFADGSLALAEQRRRAHARLGEAGARFDAFYGRARALWQEYGIEAAGP